MSASGISVVYSGPFLALNLVEAWHLNTNFREENYTFNIKATKASETISNTCCFEETLKNLGKYQNWLTFFFD